MTPEKWSALLSLVAALVISVAVLFTWYDAGWGGGGVMTRRWVKVMIGFVIALLLASIVLLLVSI